MTAKSVAKKIAAASLENPVTKPIAVTGLSIAYPFILVHQLRKEMKPSR